MRIDRRKFIKITGLGLAAPSLGIGSIGGGGCGGDGGQQVPGPDGAIVDGVDAGAVLVDAATVPQGVAGADLANRTPASLVHGTRAELDVDLAVVAGTLPTDLHGHYMMVCAVPWEDGTPIVNGDGMIHRLDFSDGATLRTRLAKTPCYYAEQAVAGTDAAFANQSIARMSPTLGVRTQANTALVPMGAGRVLATYDAGRPFEIDPVSLDVITAVGHTREWRGALPDLLSGFIGNVFPLLQTTAHPAFDPNTDELFAINFAVDVGFLGEVFTDIVRWDGVGELQRWSLVDSAGTPIKIEQSGHQIQVTERYVVVMDSAFRIEFNPLDPNAFLPQNTEAILYVVERADLAAAGPGSEVLARKFTMQREAPHFLVDYENPKGLLTVHLIHNSAFDASEWLKPTDVTFDAGTSVRADLLGMLSATTDQNFIGMHVIDVPGNQVIASESKYLSHPDVTWGITLFAHRGIWSPGKHEDLWWVGTGFQSDILPRRVGEAYAEYVHRTVPMNELPFAEGKRSTLFRTNVRDAAIADSYAFPTGRAPSSPHFVPRAGSASGDDGYIVCTVVSDDTDTQGSSGDEFWIFDAADLAAGPLCRLGHPELVIPYSLHTTWLPTIEARTADYKVTARDDYGEEVDKLSPELQQIFEDEVYPRFV